MVDRKISDFPDGGPVESGDEFAVARSGENYKVLLGTSVNYDAGSDVGELLVLDDDGAGNPRYPAADGSLITDLPIPTVSLGDLTDVDTVGADDDGVQYGFEYDSVTGGYSLTPVDPQLSLGDLTNVDVSGATTNAAPYSLTYSTLTGGYALEEIDDTAGTAYPVQTITGNTTLNSSHAFQYIIVNSASTVTITVAETLPADTEIVFWQQGAGAIVFALGSGVTNIYNPGTLTTQGTGSSAALKRISTGKYNLTIAPAISITTSQIANDAVTYAKMQNISATNRVLGRQTAGSGDTEEWTVGIAANNIAKYSSVGSLDAGTAYPWTAGSDAVASLGVSGTVTGSRSGSAAGQFFRIGSDGQCVLFYRSTTQVGNISVTGSATAYNTSSDYRLKENVIELTDASARLMQLRPVEFTFVSDPENLVTGFLAHEVAEILPNAVTGVKDAEEELTCPCTGEKTGETAPAYQSLDHSKMVPLLVAALQDALRRIEILENGE